MERIPLKVFINLRKRPDRLEQFQEQATMLGVHYERFEAVPARRGPLGCALSHLSVLCRAQDEGVSAVMVCEDDAQFMGPRATLDQAIHEFLDHPSAVGLGLGYNAEVRGRQISGHLVQCTEFQTMSCYVVKAAALPALIALLAGGVHGLARNGATELYACDMIWKSCHRSSSWCIPIDRLVIQRPSYSDNEKKIVDYKC